MSGVNPPSHFQQLRSHSLDSFSYSDSNASQIVRTLCVAADPVSYLRNVVCGICFQRKPHYASFIKKEALVIKDIAAFFALST